MKILCDKKLLYSFQSNETCEINLKKDVQKFIRLETNDRTYIVKNFDNFTEIRSKCDLKINAKDFRIYLFPNHQIILDETLQLEKTFLSDETIDIYLARIKALDFYEGKKAKFFSCCLFFHASILDIYLKGSPMTKSQCKESIFQNLTSFIQPYLGLAFRYVLFPKIGLCKSIFRQSSAEMIQFGRLSNSFLLNNRLFFTGTSETPLKSLYSLNYFMYYESLTSNLLDKYLFIGIQELYVTDVVSIESGILKHFRNLKYIDIVHSKYQDFFHHDTNWFKDLNDDVFVNLRDKKDIDINVDKHMRIGFTNDIEDFTFFSLYRYPNEDICQFKDFPHSHLVIPVLDTKELITCTCTLKWLQFYYKIYSHFLTVTHDFQTFRNDSFENQNILERHLIYNFCANELIDCNFIEKFNTCNISQAQIHHVITDMEIFYGIKWLQFILLTIIQPIFGFIGLINNLMVLLVIYNKNKKKLFKDPMYRHIQINATFNILVCLVMILSLINDCIDGNAHSPYCSSVYMENSAQYFKIIFSNFLGDIFRTGMNVTYIFFSLHRFILVSNSKENKFFKRIYNLNLKIYLLFILIFSVLINLFRIFQYEIKQFFDSIQIFPYEIFNEVLCNNAIVLGYKIKCKLLDIFKLINKSFNGIFLFVLNFAIDVFILKHFNKDIDHKIEIRSGDADISDLIKKKKKVNRMVIINSTIYFISHVPEFVVSVLLISFKKEIYKICGNQGICDLINEEAQFFNSISIMMNFYVLLLFDKNFRESFDNLKENLKSGN